MMKTKVVFHFSDGETLTFSKDDVIRGVKNASGRPIRAVVTVDSHEMLDPRASDDVTKRIKQKVKVALTPEGKVVVDVRSY